MTKILAVLYLLSPVICNWVYLHLADQVNDTGERLLMVTSTIGFDPTLPIIGAMFFVRDIVQQRIGRLFTVVLILIGTIISAVVSPEVALASGAAFLLSESTDMAIFTSLHMRRPALAVLFSGLAASFVDTFSFLLIAFGSIDTWESQVIGKVITTIICTVAFAAWRRTRHANH